MRIIRNFLILCMLMCGLVFAVRQAGAAMGKGDVLAYRACYRGRIYMCIPKLLDMRTLLSLVFSVPGAQMIFWMENGDLYTQTEDLSLYLWNGKVFSKNGSISPCVSYEIS
jgi:hypothetical protein